MTDEVTAAGGEEEGEDVTITDGEEKEEAEGGDDGARQDAQTAPTNARPQELIDRMNNRDKQAVMRQRCLEIQVLARHLASSNKSHHITRLGELKDDRKGKGSILRFAQWVQPLLEDHHQIKLRNEWLEPAQSLRGIKGSFTKWMNKYPGWEKSVSLSAFAAVGQDVVSRPTSAASGEPSDESASAIQGTGKGAAAKSDTEITTTDWSKNLPVSAFFDPDMAAFAAPHVGTSGKPMVMTDSTKELPHQTGEGYPVGNLRIPGGFDESNDDDEVVAVPSSDLRGLQTTRPSEIKNAVERKVEKDAEETRGEEEDVEMMRRLAEWYTWYVKDRRRRKADSSLRDRAEGGSK